MTVWRAGSRRKRSSGRTSKLEETLALHIRAEGLPEPAREHRFHPTRLWRLDFAWPEKKVGLECEGGIWTDGAHTRGAHFTSDCEKYNAAALLGWRIFRFTTDMVSDGTAIRVAKEALA